MLFRSLTVHLRAGTQDGVERPALRLPDGSIFGMIFNSHSPIFSLVLFGFHSYTYPNTAMFGDVSFPCGDFRIYTNKEGNDAH